MEWKKKFACDFKRLQMDNGQCSREFVGLPINFKSQCPHGQLRSEVLGVGVMFCKATL
jgi:hypothetical protein